MSYKSKAITPIVATILLVVVAVILVTIVLNWGRDFSNKALATTDTEKLSKSNASEFVYTKAFSDGVIQFNYAPPANLKDQEIIITGYKIFFDNNETSEISFTSNHTLSQGLNIIPLTSFSDQNVTSRKMDIQLKTSDGKYITLNNVTNPDPYVALEEEESEVPEGIGLTPVNGEIWYLEHLAYIDTNSTTLAGSYTLMRDLDFEDSGSYYSGEINTDWTTGTGWDPIGGLNNSFVGDFDGGGFTINNLYINRSDTNYVGLFGYTGGYSRINYLKIEDVNILGKQYVGSLAGYNLNKRINLVKSTGVVSGTSYVGGLIGRDVSGAILNSYSTCSVYGTSYVGGFVGDYFPGSGLRVSNSYSSGFVSGTSLVGGFMGVNPYTIVNCFYDTNTSGQSDTGKGTPKTTAQMKQQATFTDWNFSTIWEMQNNTTYPYLKTNLNNLKEAILFLPTPGNYTDVSASDTLLFYAKMYNPQGDYSCVWNSNLIGNFASDCNSMTTFGTLGDGTHTITLSISDDIETFTSQVIITISIHTGCAFIYSFDGEKYNPEQAISDFAVHKEYEYPTYGILRTLKEENNHYKLGIWEKVPETQYIDTIELWKLIHPKNTTVIAEQTSGVLHTIKEKEYPIEATGTDNQSYLSKITEEDNDYWVTNMINFDYINPPSFDELYLKFSNNYSNNEKVKLVVRAKDTGLLSSDWRNFVTLLDGPDKRGYEYLNSENDIFEDLTNYIQNTGLLYVYQKINGEYQLIDSFRFGNVEFYHTWAIEIQETEEPIELKLVGLPYAHQIDEVYLDRSIDEEIEIVKIKGNITETNTDYLASEIETLADTRDYDYFKLDLGDYILLDFYDDSNITLTEEQTYTTLLYADAYSESYSLIDNPNNIVNEKNIDLLKEIISTDTLITKLFTRRFYENNPLKTSLPSVYKIG